MHHLLPPSSAGATPAGKAEGLLRWMCTIPARASVGLAAGISVEPEHVPDAGLLTFSRDQPTSLELVGQEQIVLETNQQVWIGWSGVSR